MSPLASGEIPLAVKNGERGEETDRFPRGSDQERFPLYSLRKNYFFKTFQWNVLNVLYLYSPTKAATSLLLGIFSLAENPSFATLLRNSPFRCASRAAPAGASKRFALCGGRLRDAVPKYPAKGDTVPFGNP